jgi:hypothetical protein
VGVAVDEVSMITVPSSITVSKHERLRRVLGLGVIETRVGVPVNLENTHPMVSPSSSGCCHEFDHRTSMKILGKVTGNLGSVHVPESGPPEGKAT